MRWMKQKHLLPQVGNCNVQACLGMRLLFFLVKASLNTEEVESLVYVQGNCSGVRFAKLAYIENPNHLHKGLFTVTSCHLLKWSFLASGA